MGASGHIAGVINPAAKNKRSHWIGKSAALPAEADAWLAGAVEHPGSWWTDWSTWLASHAGKGKCPRPRRPATQVQSHRARPWPLRQADSLIPDSSFQLHRSYSMTQDIVIVAAARTAIGKFGGTLAKTAAPELGATVIKDLLRRSGLSGEQISEVILGQVLTAGSSQNPARQSVIKSGLPQGVPAMTINKVCGSGLKAVMLAGSVHRGG